MNKKINLLLKYLVFIFYFFNANLIFGQITTVLVQGFVIDIKTGERLPEVLITRADSGLAVTNVKGYYSFKIKPGHYLIGAQMLGYKKLFKSINVSNEEEETKLFFRLEPKLIKIKQATISGKRFTENISYKTYELLHGDLRDIPQFGEPDAIRALQSLPGISSMNDFSTQLFVRGGNFDETLISLDNAPVYNPYHTGGIFGMFNSDFIRSEKLYPSNYPVNSGGYLSGALNILTKDGNRENLKGSVSLGLVASRLYVESPVGKGSIVFSARRTYLDLVSALFIKQPLPYYFYDLFLKAIYPADKKNLFSFSAFYSKDIFKIFTDNTLYKNPEIKNEPSWGNTLFNFKFTHLFTKNNSLNIQLYNSDANNKANAESLYENNKTRLLFDNNIKDLTGKIKLNYSLTGQELEAGFEVKSIKLNYAWDIGKSELSEFGFKVKDAFYDFAKNPFNYENSTTITSAYISDKLQISEALSLSLGLRGSYVQNLKKNLISPLLKTKYVLSKNVNLSFSFRRYYQYLYVIKDQSNPLFDPFSIYFLQDKENNLAESNNISAGVNINNIFSNTRLEIEGYYKGRKNIASSYKRKTEPYTFENGYSAGLDVLLKRDKGKITGWLSYSLSRSIKTNENYSYFARYDRTNTFKILINYNLSESWQLTAYWIYASGLPYTPKSVRYIGGKKFDPTNSYYDNQFYWRTIDGLKNSARSSDYNRLDIGINGSFIWGTLFIKPYLQILNVYNSPNPIFYEKNGHDNPNPTWRDNSASFIVPTFGVTVEF